MNKITNWPGEIRDGKLRIFDREAFERGLVFMDGNVNISIESGDLRSSQHNRYLWGVVYDRISAHTGYSPEEVHEICKSMFCKRTKTHNNKIYEYTGSTAIMTEDEFKEFVKKCERWGSEEFNILWI